MFFRHDHVDLASVLYHVMRYIMHYKEYIIMYNMTHTHLQRVVLSVRTAMSVQGVGCQ